MRYRSFALALALLLVPLSGLFAAGSAPKPKSSTQPEIAAYNDGVALLKKKDFAGAQAKFESALAIKEDFPEAHNNLAYSLRRQGAENYDQALAHYNRALELDPKLAEAYEYRGILYVLRGEKEKAQADYQTLLQLNRGLAHDLEAAIESGQEPTRLTGVANKIW